MRCSHCHRPLNLLDPRHPQRLLLPRCRFCRAYTLSWVHKVVLIVLCVTALYLLSQSVFIIK